MCAIRPQGSIARRTIPPGSAALRAGVVGAVLPGEELTAEPLAISLVLGVDAVPAASGAP